MATRKSTPSPPDPIPPSLPTEPAEEEPTGELPTVELRMPGFRALPALGTGGPEEWTDAAAAWGVGSEDGGEPDDGTGRIPGADGATTTETTGSSPGSIDDPIGVLVFRLAAMLIGGASMLVHAWRTPGDDQAIWIADEQQAEGIAGPLSRIVERRLPTGPAGSADVSDGVEAMVNVAGYAMNHGLAEAQYRAERASGPQFVETTATERPRPEPEPAPPRGRGRRRAPAAEPEPEPAAEPEPDAAAASALDALRGARGA